MGPRLVLLPGLSRLAASCTPPEEKDTVQGGCCGLVGAQPNPKGEASREGPTREHKCKEGGEGMVFGHYKAGSLFYLRLAASDGGVLAGHQLQVHATLLARLHPPVEARHGIR